MQKVMAHTKHNASFITYLLHKNLSILNSKTIRISREDSLVYGDTFFLQKNISDMFVQINVNVMMVFSDCIPRKHRQKTSCYEGNQRIFVQAQRAQNVLYVETCSVQVYEFHLYGSSNKLRQIASDRRFIA